MNRAGSGLLLARCLRAVKLLETHAGVTLDDLAEELGCSRRQATRYLNAVEEIGCQVIARDVDGDEFTRRRRQGFAHGRHTPGGGTLRYRIPHGAWRKAAALR